MDSDLPKKPWFAIGKPVGGRIKHIIALPERLDKTGNRENRYRAYT
jgi:hypothetical protein